MHRLKFIIIGVAMALIMAVAAFPMATSAAPDPLPNGFTAAKVATSGETITGTINATNYDLGIYIGPGITNVTVNGATVSGANDEGIMVQDAGSGIVIENSTISGNAVSPFSTAEGTEVKAIALAGTTDVLVKDNTVEDNGHGGIGLYDDGPNSVFALTAIDSTPVAGTGNVITGNTVNDNGFDCSIVVSAKNSGPGVSNNTVSNNAIQAYDPGEDNTLSVGGIIIAGGSYGPVKVMGTLIEDNTVDGGLLAGISIHGHAGSKIRGTQLIGNTFSNNGQPFPIDFPPYSAGEVLTASEKSEGIEIAGDPGVIIGTPVISDTVLNDFFGVFHVGDTGTTIVNMMGNATVPVGP